MSRREVAVWIFASCTWLTIIVSYLLMRNESSIATDVAVKEPGTMEKKYECLRQAMTKAEVDAILGKPTGATYWGGSKSTCEQIDYYWSGDDGRIIISFRKNPNDEMFAAPGPEHRINRMNWQPKVNPMTPTQKGDL